MAKGLKADPELAKTMPYLTYFGHILIKKGSKWPKYPKIASVARRTCTGLASLSRFGRFGQLAQLARPDLVLASSYGAGRGF